MCWADMGVQLSAFAELDWQRLDVHAIVSGAGLAAVDERRRDACHGWLRARGYIIESIDFRQGLAPAIRQLGIRLRWEEQFGYELDPSQRNLDALRDGFLFETADGSGVVLDVQGPEAAWREDPTWFLGLLAIAQECSREQLALGKRFFVLLVLEDDSPLVGMTIYQTTVPGPFWAVSPKVHEFEV